VIMGDTFLSGSNSVLRRDLGSDPAAYVVTWTTRRSVR
jgi:hypothetical protein